MKLYFVRHGESEANLLREFSNRGFKHGLTERGFQQAETLAQSLSSVSFSMVYSSPLMRAFQTAQVLSNKLKIPLEITEALREYDCGILEGRSDPESWAIYQQVFDRWLAGDPSASIPEGESLVAIQSRFIPFINKIVQQNLSEDFLLVGHGGLFRAVFPTVFANIDFDFVRDIHIEHTTPIIAEVRDGVLFCVRWGDLNFAV